MGLPDLSDDPQALTAAARAYPRKSFLTVPTAISGANFLVAKPAQLQIVLLSLHCARCGSKPTE